MLIPGVHVKIVKSQSSRQSGRSQALAEQPKATGEVSSCLKGTRRGELEEGSSDLFLWTPYPMHGYIRVHAHTHAHTHNTLCTHKFCFARHYITSSLRTRFVIFPN